MDSIIPILESQFVVCASDLDPASHEHFTHLQRSHGAMGPEQKSLLAELDKRFAAQEKRFDRLEHKLNNTAAKLDATAASLDSTAVSSATRLDALESAARVFDEWRLGVDGVLDHLRIEVSKLSTLKLEVMKITKYWERTMVDSPFATLEVFATTPVLEVGKTTKSSSAPASLFASPRDTKPVLSPTFKSAGYGDFQATPRSLAETVATRPSGHHIEFGNQEGAFGVVTTERSLFGFGN
jgi:uncharacterized coiled-coil protein SlyX